MLESRQFQQFAALAKYSAKHSSFYRDRFHVAGLAPEAAWDWGRFARLPKLSRRELLQHAGAIHSKQVPERHGNLSTVMTSGSTGEKVEVRRTGITELKWLSLVMREHLWHERDFSQSLAAIRAHIPAMDDDAVARTNGWGPPVTLLQHTGPAYSQPLSLDVKQQAQWLLRRNPGYLITYPTNLAALLDEFSRLGDVPSNLHEVRTVGETVGPDLAERCRSTLGVPLSDVYSSQEVGPIAAMCPQSGLYHVHAESVIVEVIDDAGQPCGPGEVGRVVITDLHNFATPLIRYELRDYAETGPPCPCGRGLPTLRRIVGRERNMVRLPSGERFWPFVGYPRFSEVAPVLQYQAIQHSLTELELRLVVAGGVLEEVQRTQLATIVRETIGHPFEVRFRLYPDEIPRSPSGKFEEFVCLVEDGNA